MLFGRLSHALSTLLRRPPECRKSDAKPQSVAPRVVLWARGTLFFPWETSGSLK